jgi:hypothetical protein
VNTNTTPTAKAEANSSAPVAVVPANSGEQTRACEIYKDYKDYKEVRVDRIANIREQGLLLFCVAFKIVHPPAVHYNGAVGHIELFEWTFCHFRRYAWSWAQGWNASEGFCSGDVAANGDGWELPLRYAGADVRSTLAITMTANFERFKAAMVRDMVQFGEKNGFDCGYEALTAVHTMTCIGSAAIQAVLDDAIADHAARGNAHYATLPERGNNTILGRETAWPEVGVAVSGFEPDKEFIVDPDGKVRETRWMHARRMQSCKITSARIAGLPQQVFGPNPEVFATVDGVEVKLFDYYSDEISFTPDEFIGLTVAEGRALKQRKDKDYLQS